MSHDELLWELLRSFRRSAWRLEALDRYTVPSDEAPLAAFLRGDPPPLPDDELTEYLAILRSLPGQGRTMGRVHAIVGSLTPYLRYEVEWGYPPLDAAGEEVRILHRPSWRETPFGHQPPDFWLVDDETVALMRYDGEGRWLGMDIVTAEHEVAPYRALRDLAIRESVPLSQYIAAIRRVPLDPTSLLEPAQRIA